MTTHALISAIVALIIILLIVVPIERYNRSKLKKAQEEKLKRMRYENQFREGCYYIGHWRKNPVQEIRFKMQVETVRKGWVRYRNLANDKMFVYEISDMYEKGIAFLEISEEEAVTESKE